MSVFIAKFILRADDTDDFYIKYIMFYVYISGTKEKIDNSPLNISS